MMTAIAVFADSRGGNTKKVADAMAGELGVTVGDLSRSLPAGTRLLFLGSGVYGSAPGIEMMKFVTDNAFAGCRVALFGTSMSESGAKNMLAAMEDALKRKGAVIAGTFQCRGKFLLFNRGRPNAGDLAEAKAFARDMLRAE